MEAFRLPADTRVGRVRLRIREPGTTVGFYRRVLGLVPLKRDADGAMTLAAVPGGSPLVTLILDPAAPPRPRKSAGLYHFAVLVPDRKALADALIRTRRSGWPLQGLSDHGVSEAIYLADPEGNGIELYADRPRQRWPRGTDGIEMMTQPLDVRSLLAERVGAGEPPAGLPAGTRMGHIHLQVSGLDAAEAFYHHALGLDVVTRRYPGALFMSAGGYHHHVAVNTWAGAGAAPPPRGAAGLVDFRLVVAGAAVRDQVVARLRRLGLDPAPASSGAGAAWRVADPDGNAVVIAGGD